MTRLIYILVSVVLIVLVNCCKKESQSLGVGYAPIVGSWRLVQRHIPANPSSLTFTTQIIPPLPLQEITFSNDGSMSSVGKETEYYRSSKYYRVDTTGGSKRIGFIISDVYSAFYHGLIIRKDTLTLVPCQTQDCNISLIKSR